VPAFIYHPTSHTGRGQSFGLVCVCLSFKCIKGPSLKSPYSLCLSVSLSLTSYTRAGEHVTAVNECECAPLRVLLEHLKLVPSPRFLCTLLSVRGCGVSNSYQPLTRIRVCVLRFSLLGLNIVADRVTEASGGKVLPGVSTCARTGFERVCVCVSRSIYFYMAHTLRAHTFFIT